MSLRDVNVTPIVPPPFQSNKIYSGFEGHMSLFVWTSIFSIAIYCSSKFFYRNLLAEERENAIPNGPTGLPILGMLLLL